MFLKTSICSTITLLNPTSEVWTLYCSIFGLTISAMARPRKVKRRPNQKQIKETASVVIDDATAVPNEAATLDKPFVPPKLIRDEKSSIETSWSNAQMSTVDKPKTRTDSISMTDCDTMARAQLLASLESTIPSPNRVRISVSGISTRGHESQPSAGVQKVSHSAVAAWSIGAGVIILVALLVVLMFSMDMERSLLHWNPRKPGVPPPITVHLPRLSHQI